SFARDVRYAIRGMRKSPAFTAAAVLSLALGIALNCAIFSLANVVVFGSMPYRDPDRKSTRLNSSHVSISYAVFCLKKKKQKHTPVTLVRYLLVIVSLSIENLLSATYPAVVDAIHGVFP